jgi:Cys-tRNA(Pro)/Cys-tRNA(Cys) deacylase
MTDLETALEQLLAERGVDHRLIHHGEIWTVDDGLAALRDEYAGPDAVVKTQAFDANGRWIFAAVAEDRRIAEGRLARSIGVARSRLTMLGPDVIENQLGYQLGGLTPLHIDPRISVVIDPSVVDRTMVYCVLGTRSITVALAARDLVEVAQATVSEIARS